MAVFLVAIAARAAASPELPPGASEATQSITAEPVFATVDGTAITAYNFDSHLELAIREKFFHRRPPEEQLGGLRREVGDRLIERILLLAEAKRRGLQTDPEKLRQSVAQFEQRNSANSRWLNEREQLLPALEQELGDNDLLEQIEKMARQTPEPLPEQLRQIYDGHRDAFTQPEQVRLSIILLKVNPGLVVAEKEKILEQAKSLHARLVAGEDFATLAKEYSNDVTAPNGGNMGNVHRGMMGENVYKQIEGLAPGTLTEPLVLMEGMAILRLDERIAPQLKSLDEPESHQRAVKLWKRETADQQWRQFRASLRQAAAIKIADPVRYGEAVAAKPVTTTPKSKKQKTGVRTTKANKR